jgi:hypothetical protein
MMNVFCFLFLVFLSCGNSDLILSQIVRRVANMTLGDFVEKEIARALGVELFIGLPHKLEERVVEVRGLIFLC